MPACDPNRAKAVARSRSRRRQGRPSGARARRAAERRDAILAAALEEFSARGFAAARLDDVAQRAGVAKGTIYLYFADKEALFQELIRAELSPWSARSMQASHADMPIRRFAERLVEVFVARDLRDPPQGRDPAGASPKARAFPSSPNSIIARSSSRVMAAIRALLQRAVERGELKHDALVRFPQLLVGARARRHHLERTVRPLRAARRSRADARPFRYFVW